MTNNNLPAGIDAEIVDLLTTKRDFDMRFPHKVIGENSDGDTLEVRLSEDGDLQITIEQKLTEDSDFKALTTWLTPHGMRQLRDHLNLFLTDED